MVHTISRGFIITTRDYATANYPMRKYGRNGKYIWLDISYMYIICNIDHTLLFPSSPTSNRPPPFLKLSCNCSMCQMCHTTVPTNWKLNLLLLYTNTFPNAQSKDVQKSITSNWYVVSMPITTCIELSKGSLLVYVCEHLMYCEIRSHISPMRSE